MDTEFIKQMATDINTVAAESFQSGKKYAERLLLAKIANLEVENEKLKNFLNSIVVNNYKGNIMTHREITAQIEQALKPA